LDSTIYLTESYFVSPTACARGGGALQQTILLCPLDRYAYIVADRQNFEKMEFCGFYTKFAISAFQF
jgi:hypothetical protein